jgi:6-phospho-3-hexuloisomerase
MDILQCGSSILKEISGSFSQIDVSETKKLIERIKLARRVFFVGAGRSKVMLAAFCMRLNQLGIESYIAGNIPCPPAGKGDLVIAASGSCETPSIMAILKRLKKLDIDIFLFTASPDTAIHAVADTIMRIQAPYTLSGNEGTSRQLMRTLFEQTVFIIGETIVEELSADTPVEEIVTKHTNLE